MKTILDEAYTWFLERCTQLPSGEIHIRLVEGIKGADRLPVHIGEDIVGPYYPVAVKQTSRVVDIRFPHVLVFFTYNESYDGKDLELDADGNTVLRKVNASSFRKYSAAKTSALEMGIEPLNEYLLWTEDQVFQVLVMGEPEITESADKADVSIKRTQTGAAS